MWVRALTAREERREEVVNGAQQHCTDETGGLKSCAGDHVTSHDARSNPRTGLICNAKNNALTWTDFYNTLFILSSAIY